MIAPLEPTALKVILQDALTIHMKTWKIWDHHTESAPQLYEDGATFLVPVGQENGGYRPGCLAYLVWFLCGQSFVASVRIPLDASTERIRTAVSTAANDLRAFIVARLRGEPDPENTWVARVEDCEPLPSPALEA